LSPTTFPQEKHLTGIIILSFLPPYFILIIREMDFKPIQFDMKIDLFLLLSAPDHVQII
jgi:hypothetical protein